MKVVKKNVYYCDHCKKRSLSGGHMKTHETHCTANPKRACRFCGNKSIEQIIVDYKEMFTLISVEIEDIIFGYERIEELQVRWTGDPVTLKDIMGKVRHSPTCTLAILRQVGFNRYYFGGIIEKFDYKKSLQDEFAERNKYSIEDYYNN